MSSNRDKAASYNGAPPKYLNDFSKALAGEVRILLAEVGQLRDERRQLQYEIAELMAMKSKHGGGGTYSPNWHPKAEEPSTEAPAPPPEDGPPAPAKPGWRVVHKRAERKEKATAKSLPTSLPTPAPPPEPPKMPNMPAWAQWRPDPVYAPIAQSAVAISAPPQRAGLFGPPTPPPK